MEKRKYEDVNFQQFPTIYNSMCINNDKVNKFKCKSPRMIVRICSQIVAGDSYRNCQSALVSLQMGKNLCEKCCDAVVLFAINMCGSVIFDA